MSLLVVILFVIMLAEIMTYIAVNINYSTMEQSASLASIQGAQASLLKLSLIGFLHSSLYAAVSTLATYEGTPSLRGAAFINNTQYALRSLMMNGTLYGVNLTGYMGNLTVADFNGTIETQLAHQGIGITMNPGSNLTVFQNGPSAINATYSVLATINASGSSYNLPITETIGIQLNGTPDLASLIRAAPATILISPNISAAVRVGGENAIMGTTGPFSFAFGTVVNKDSASATCAGVPSSEQNKNYILAIDNAMKITNNVCGMGGLITSAKTQSATFNVPYLIYPGTLLPKGFTNGTQILLDGPALSAYSLSSLQSAIQNGEYFTSPYLPNYLDSAQGVLAGRNSGGLFSFGLLDRTVPDMIDTSAVQENVIVQAGNIILPPSFTVSFWVYKSPVESSCDSVISPGYNAFIIYTKTVNGCSAGSVAQTPLIAKYVDSAGTTHDGLASTGIPVQTWTQAALVFGQNTLTWYINGNKVAAYGGLVDPPTNANAFLIGAGDHPFNGSIAGVQVYNAPLSAFSIQNIYRNGLAGAPPASIEANLIAWYPLNGNANDYSGFGRNGEASNALTYAPLSGYYGDPIYQNAFTNFNTSEVEGVLNCGNINQCTNSAQHLYIGGMPLETNGSIAVNESAALNLGNALIPAVLSFDGGYVQEHSPVSWLEAGTHAYSMSIWIYPTSSSGVILDEYNSSGVNDPWISMASGTGYIGYKGTSQVCSSIGAIPLNSWSNIVVTFDGTDILAGYVNGTVAFSPTNTGARTTLSYNGFYDLGKANSGTTCGGGSGAAYNGMMADFQVYNTVLSASQVTTLYLNDSVDASPAASPSLWMWLSSRYDGNLNNTQETVNNNYGVFYDSGGICSVATVANGVCGLDDTPP